MSGGGGGRRRRGPGRGGIDNGNTNGNEPVITLIPTIRSREIRFRAQGLLPNTRHFPFFDGIRVDAYCIQLDFNDAAYSWRFENRETWDVTDRVDSDRTTEFNQRWRELTPEGWDQAWHPIYGSSGPNFLNDVANSNFEGALVSDANGTLEGTFYIPNNQNLSFDAGERIFSLYDITTENDDTSASRAKATYNAQGTTVTNTVIIRRPRPGGSGGDDGARDPVAQTFFVDNPEGAFITKVGIYFQSKDTNEVPVNLQIRETVNGYPSTTETISGASTWLFPSSINVSEDASAVTNFTLPAPTYLAPGQQYAIVLITNSLEYNVFISRMGEFALGETDRKVTRQPSLGSLFLSQNAETWEPSQFDDLKFDLYRAKFSSTSGTAIFQNESTRQRLLPADPLLFDSGDATVRVIHPNHGLFVNDTISLLGMDSSTTFPSNIVLNDVIGNRTITAVDGTGYTFEAGDTPTSGGRFGGSNVRTNDQILMDYVIPSLSYGAPENTSVAFGGKFTDGKSFAGTETPYGKPDSDAPFTTFVPYEKIYFDNPKVVAAYDNEVASMAGARSATIQATLSTSTDYLSPVINAERLSLTGVNNVIDNQDSAATSGFNVPLYFVPETDPTLGSSLAKHVTNVVTLQSEAVGIKVLLAANRPAGSNFAVYYKAVAEDVDLLTTAWTLIAPEETYSTDNTPTSFQEYRYLIGGTEGTLDPFKSFQIKIVMTATNSSRPPSFKDLRAIALLV
jgi:hypothetical protein